jgi:hypothetical protein
LLAAAKPLSAADVESIGRWKDAANSDAKWKANIASVAYTVWMQAASELPQCPEDAGVVEFLKDWSKVRETLAVCSRRGSKFTDSKRFHAVQNRTVRTGSTQR